MATYPLTTLASYGPSIGAQFVGSGTALSASDVAGVVPATQANWNVLTGSNFSSVGLKDSNGVATTALISLSSAGYTNGTAVTAAPSGNLKMATGEVYALTGTMTLTLSGIPYTAYDVYVFCDCTSSLASGTQTVSLTPSGGTAQYFSLSQESGGYLWTAATSTWNGSPGPPYPVSVPAANYVCFPLQTGSSFTISAFGTNYAAFNGMIILSREGGASLGVNGSVAPAIARALATSAALGVTGVPFRPTRIVAASTSNSLGVTGAAFRPSVSLPLTTSASLGISSGTNRFSIVRRLTMPGGSASVGINTGNGFGLATNRALYGVASIGVNPQLFLPCLTRAISGSNSVGITGTANPAVNRTIRSFGSLGVTGFARVSRVYTIATSASLGLTGTVTPAMIRAAVSSGSMGISLSGRMSLNRALKTLASMGVTGTVFILAVPSSNQPNVIILFEATDTASPTTFGAILPRDYQTITLDQTTSSYPKPFALLN